MFQQTSCTPPFKSFDVHRYKVLPGGYSRALSDTHKTKFHFAQITLSSRSNLLYTEPSTSVSKFKTQRCCDMYLEMMVGYKVTTWDEGFINNSSVNDVAIWHASGKEEAGSFMLICIHQYHVNYPFWPSPKTSSITETILQTIWSTLDDIQWAQLFLDMDADKVAAVVLNAGAPASTNASSQVQLQHWHMWKIGQNSWPQNPRQIQSVPLQAL